MTNIIFEAPPEEALGEGERERANIFGLNIRAIENSLKAHPGEWAKLYGTEEVPPTTRNTINRWEKKPGFEVKRRRVEGVEGNPLTEGKRQPDYKYEVWVRYVADQTGYETPDPQPQVPAQVQIDPALQPEVEVPINPFAQSVEAEGTRGIGAPPPVPRQRYIPKAQQTVEPLTPTNFQ